MDLSVSIASAKTNGGEIDLPLVASTPESYAVYHGITL